MSVRVRVLPLLDTVGPGACPDLLAGTPVPCDSPRGRGRGEWVWPGVGIRQRASEDQTGDQRKGRPAVTGCLQNPPMSGFVDEEPEWTGPFGPSTADLLEILLRLGR